MVEIIAIVALFMIIMVQFLMMYLIIDFFQKKEKDLLNRIMSGNYQTYVQAEVLKEERPLTDEEIYEQQLERGIPI